MLGPAPGATGNPGQRRTEHPGSEQRRQRRDQTGHGQEAPGDVRIGLGGPQHPLDVAAHHPLRLLDSGNHILTATEPAWAEPVRELDEFLD